MPATVEKIVAPGARVVIRGEEWIVKRRELPHHRTLRLTFEDHSMFVLRLDEGVGAWSTGTRTRFPFHLEAQDQAQVLLQAELAVRLRSQQHKTVLYVLEETT